VSRGATDRPFYGSFAWAFDLLVERPVATECAHIAAVLSARAVPRDARLLDAGCGTGRYALTLAGLGYCVTGLDLSPELIAVARQRPGAAAVGFEVGDLTRPAVGPPYAAVLCRGVLNDVLDDEPRRDAFDAFAQSLERDGVLLLDVRDWAATARRRSRDPIHERTVETPRGRLVYRGEVRLDHVRRRMLVAERHTLTTDGGTTSADYDFVMRCWTQSELDERLAGAGFVAVEYRGAYDPAVPLGSTDRIVAVASRS
jgi:SAM-dependent methyltransferase